MIRYLLIPVFLSLGIMEYYFQTLEGFPVADNIDLPDAKFTPARIFHGSALFGYIDGGAELYLEYGFTDAAIIELTWKGGKYKTEIFRMKGPEEAFGIYSVSKNHCNGMPLLSKFICYSHYQLQICKGPFYISIINGGGEAQDSSNMVALGKIITGKINDPDADLTKYLPDTSPDEIQKNSFLAKGRLGIVNGSPDLEDFFLGMENYTVVILKCQNETIISVRFAEVESLNKFLKGHNFEQNALPDIQHSDLVGITCKKLSGDHLYIELPK